MKKQSNLARTMVIALIVPLILAFAGCGESSAASVTTKSEESPPPAPTVTTTTTEEATPTVEATPTEEATPLSIAAEAVEVIPLPNTASNDLSNDWFSFQVQLNSVVYQLPTPFSEFAANDWAEWENGSYSLNNTLDPISHTLSTPIQQFSAANTLYVRFVNLGNNVLPLNECYVGGLSIDMSDWNRMKDPEFFLPGGITMGSDMEEVRNAYGEPTKSSQGEAFIAWTYEQQMYANVEINFDPSTKTVKKMSLRNYYLQEAISPSSPAAAGDIPDIVRRYETPAALGDDWDSYTIQYAGTLYALPAPVSAFIDNGWKVIETGVTVPAKSTKTGGYQMSKDNQTLRAQLYNYSDTEQPAENCFVIRIKNSIYEANLPLELPGGITMDSSVEDIIKAWGEPRESGASTVHDVYTYGGEVSRGGKIIINVSKETKEINVIDIENWPRELGY